MIWLLVAPITIRRRARVGLAALSELNASTELCNFILPRGERLAGSYPERPGR